MEQLKQLQEQKESLINMRQALQVELNQRLNHMELCSTKLSQSFELKCQSQEFDIKKKEILRQMERENQEIIKNSQYYSDQKRLYRERAEWIDKFNDKLKEDYKSCQKKEETIQIRNTVANGIQRLFLLQLCTIFFDKDNQKLLWGLHKSNLISEIQNNLNQNEEEQLACSLGYLGLLLQQIAKIKGVTLKHDFKFKGSRSLINENNYLYSQKPSSLKQLKVSYQLLQQNLQIIMEELNIQKQWRTLTLTQIVGKIGELLWVDA